MNGPEWSAPMSDTGLAWGVVFWPDRPRIENDPRYIRCGRCQHFIQALDWAAHSGSCVTRRVVS
jgi:hypothetical protein